MIQNAFYKDNLRLIRVTINRFLAILVITALGVAFFAGLRVSGPDMRTTASTYYDKLNFMDVRLLSTIGFNENDLDAIKNTQGVQSVMPAYSYDTLVSLSETNLTIHLLSLNTDTGNDINRPELIDGRMPQKSGECLADPLFISQSGYQIGDTVHFVSGTTSPISDALKTDAYQIVGIVQDPLYISTERGSSSVGSGRTDAFFLIPSYDFSLEVYTEVYITIQKDTSISRFEAKYMNLLEPVTDSLEKTGEVRSSLRFNEIKEESEKELDDAKKQVADGYKELNDGQKKLDDARAELNDGWTEYNRNKADFEKQISDGQKQLDNGYSQYYQGLKEYNAGLSDFEAAKESANAQFSAAEEQLAQGIASYEKGLDDYTEGKALYDTLNSTLAAGNTPEAISTIQVLIGQLQSSNPDLSAVLSAYVANPTDPSNAAAAQGAVEQFGNTLALSKQQLDDAKKTLDEQNAVFTQSQAEAQKKFEETQVQLDASKKQLDSAKKTLDKKSKELDQARQDGQKQLAEAEKKLTDGEAELTANENNYTTAKADSEVELADAQKKIDDGEKQLSELETPEWYVLDPETNIGFIGYKQDAQRIDAISLVLPLLFFLVAVLVTMTSMTRLVESDRTYIGTLKALGYSNARIAMRYLFYAVSASLIGSIIGVIAGFNIFPRVVFNAYSILYKLPAIHAEFDLTYAVISIAVAVSCAALPALFVCLQAMHDAPAEMMRPASPRIGRRTIIERITPIWKRLNFSQKVAVRNLFRYKKRLIMTVIGVAGCTALMFTGFGLRDSITTLVSKQYGVIQNYDMQINFKQDADAADKKTLQDTIDSSSEILSSTEIFQESVDAIGSTELKSAILIVPASPSEFTGFFHMQNRETQETISLNDDSAIITEKLADLLSIKAGDSLKIRDGDGNEATVKISGIAENYLDHYIFLSPSLYRSSFRAEPFSNQILCDLENPASENNHAFSEGLLKQPIVGSVAFTSDMKSSLDTMIEALRYVVWVLIFSAAALVFVVLFSLNTINLEERSRELATIKVLGFFDGELAAYIYRENVVLTILGTLLGLLLGVGLQRYIITTMEVDMIMFSRTLLWPSYVFSAGLTIFFALLVNLIMYRQITKIDMVSSLKSIE